MYNRTENMQKDRREGKAITVLYLNMGKFLMLLCPFVCVCVCVRACVCACARVCVCVRACV